MADKSRRDRLFGAAVLLRKLELAGLASKGSEVYVGVLEDLELEDGEVREFLEQDSSAVDEALNKHGT